MQFLVILALIVNYNLTVTDSNAFDGISESIIRGQLLNTGNSGRTEAFGLEQASPSVVTPPTPPSPPAHLCMNRPESNDVCF